MSQADEETAKYKLNNNHYNYNDYGQMRKAENNQQVMPLYENCTLTNNQKSDHIQLEPSPVKSETFNYDYRFGNNTTNAADVNDQEGHNSDSVTPDYEYENINFGGKENLDKKILLQKYFRSALVGPRANIYENLCRGCNYGVFNARGPLCSFCECIVNGVSALRSDTPETSVATSNNIYENICEYCGLIYSGTNCTECKCKQVTQTQESFIETENILNLGSEELLLEKSENIKKKIKINKSKSFNKSNKPKIFSNLWDTLTKPKTTANSNTVHKKHLEIIHHVDGYEQVFHTKDTFDLKKICELKRSITSCSDQHIYGRLKQNDLNSSQEQFNSTQSLAQSTKSLTVFHSKKARISKAKFLRTQPSETSISSDNKVESNSATIFLNNSVCQWMTSLRHEIHPYNTFNDHDQETLCYPKSIPSKNVLISCKAPVVTNQTKQLQNSFTQQAADNGDSGDLTEILHILRAHNSMTSTHSWDIQEIEKTYQQQQPDCYQLMVEEFMANIINRQILQTNNSKCAMAGVNDNVNYNNSYNNNDNNIDIPLRQAILTATTVTANNHNNSNNNNRHKRQGMYLRLEDHQQLQSHNGEEHITLHHTNVNNSNETCSNNNNNNYANKQRSTSRHGERVEIAYENKNGCEYLTSLQSPAIEHNTVTTPDTPLTCSTEDLALVSRSLTPPLAGGDLTRADRRKGIHERNVLEAFEALLQQENKNQLNSANEKDFMISEQQLPDSQKYEEEITENSLQLQTLGSNLLPCITTHFPTPTLDIIKLINQQQLSTTLNTLIISYDKYLKVYLTYIHQTNTNSRAVVYKIPSKQLLRNFQRFYNYCSETNNERAMQSKTKVRELTCVSSKLKLDLNITNCREYAHLKLKNCDSLTAAFDSRQDNCAKTEYYLKTNQKIKTPPQVPKRDPKTKLSPTTEIKPFRNNKMTKPGNKLETDTNSENHKEEESIYQPIWKFETKGKVHERYRTDDDYYDLKALKQKIQQESPNLEIPKILISTETLLEEEEDHNNWEPDEEFVFTTQVKKQRSSSLTSDRMSTIRSTHSSNSSIGTSSSLSGSTITEFASSTATLASTFSCSLKHYLFRNIGIFYSLTEPKLRAIIYDYDRIHSSRYFAKPLVQSQNINDSGIGKSLSPEQCTKLQHTTAASSASSSPSTSCTSSPVALVKRENPGKCKNENRLFSASASDKCTGAKAKVNTACPSTTPAMLNNSVQAWKYQLLDVNYMEDEEDMIVSECEIVRAQQIKEDIDHSPPTQPQQFMQRFKSRSTENFLDLPIEDDKKTIAERLANMYTRFSPIQRGILNINGRNSPKSEKKAYKLNRASQSTSLYLEDGLKPKYPVFGAPLDQLELQQNVPRFVVDAVDYIERKDRIVQDGIYRACGNKFSIDELKQKLTKSYIYDSKLIVADDIHTVTSLLKQFFRDLPEPVIPQDIYSRITANLADKQGIDTIRIAIEEMKEPNKSTLRFLIKHLTNVAACSSSNRMNASNVAIVWGPSLFAQNDTYDMIGRMNTLTKVLIENYDRIFDTNERLL